MREPQVGDVWRCTAAYSAGREYTLSAYSISGWYAKRSDGGAVWWPDDRFVSGDLVLVRAADEPAPAQETKSEATPIQPQEGDTWSYSCRGGAPMVHTIGAPVFDADGWAYWPWVDSGFGGWTEDAWSDPSIKMTLVRRPQRLAVGAAAHGAQGEPATNPGAVRPAGGNETAPPSPPQPTVCARITRSGIACDLSPAHVGECRPLPRERWPLRGMSEADIERLAAWPRRGGGR